MSAPSLSALFAHIDSLVDIKQDVKSSPTYTQEELSITVIQTSLLQLGVGDISVQAGTAPASSLPVASTRVPLPPLTFSSPAESAYQRFIDARHAVTSTAALYAKQEVWDDTELESGHGTASIMTSDRIYDTPHAPVTRTWRMKRDTEGRVIGWSENVSKQQEAHAWWRGNISSIGAALASGSTSSSVHRPLANRSLFATGSANFAPFRPGGLDEIETVGAEEDEEESKSSADEIESQSSTAVRKKNASSLHALFPWDYNLPSAIHTKPPGFERGLHPDLEGVSSNSSGSSHQPTHNLYDISNASSATKHAIPSSSSSSATKLPSSGAAVAPYLAGVNTSDTLGDISSTFTSESYAEYRASVQVAQQAQLERTQLKFRNISEEIDESLFEDEDEQEQAQRLAAKQSPTSNVAAADSSSSSSSSLVQQPTEDELLAEFDLTLPSASSLKEESHAAVQARLASARNLWATSERLDVSNFHSQLPNMAIRYPFELDTFQKEAILHIEKGESVFVSAHTSAGKTVVAEYAIAIAAKHLTRAIYTSPIKTLSNQKYREFRSVLGEKNVGIITGDVSINPEASCLILTTEILRSMLYKGADLIRDVEWIIFDEVHYINDLERGVVWEEVIIMLPQHVNYVLLSATVPNTLEFADWVGRTKKKNIYVISTEKRPVPLQHFLWCKQKLFGIMDGASGKFLPEGFKKAKEEGMTLKKQDQQRRGIFKKPSWKQQKSTWIVLVNYLQKQELFPVVIFAFSKKVCEDSAYGMYSTDLTTSAEKSEITTLLSHALNRLSLNDRKLPQVLRVKDLVKRGVGLHHAGMLPILKEVVEMIFSRGLIKVLFATETFAMGVNFPCRCVVFYGTKKHDGINYRDLLPGEYTQMSGRAGRRGIDKYGIVILNCKNDEVPDEITMKHILTGKPTKLESRFRLTYNMILNLLRQEDMKVEQMIQRSFGELIAARDTPIRKQLLIKGERKLKHLKPVVCTAEGVQCTHEQMSEYFHMKYRIAEMNIHLYDLLFQSSAAGGISSNKYLCIGRLMVLKFKGLENCLAVILKNAASVSSSSSSSSSSVVGEKKSPYLAFILIPPCQTLNETYVSSAKKLGLTLGQSSATTNPRHSYIIAEFNSSHIQVLLNDKIEVDVAGILVDRFPRKLDMLCQELYVKQEKYGTPITKAQADQAGYVLPPAGPAVGGKKPPLPTYPRVILPSTLTLNQLLDPLQDLKLSIGQGDENYKLLDEQYLKQEYLQALQASPVQKCPLATQHYDQFLKQHNLQSKVAQLRSLLSNQNLDLLHDFEVRMKILQTLHYVDATDRTVLLKGRVACEINTCDSLIVTELIFENILTALEPEEIVSLLSCLIFQEKNSNVDDPSLPDRLIRSKQQLDRLTLSLGQIQLSCGLDIVPDEFVQSSLNWSMMQVVWEWAKGTKFSEICLFTNVLEGSIVRCITRLDETCRDVRNAARVIGDAVLYQKMQKCSELIKRDIVFAASLYTS